MRRSHGEAGFTLLEILIGLAVSALIMVGLVTAMGTINRGVDTAAAGLERQGSLAAALDIIGGDIARILRPQDSLDRPQRFLFSGTPEEMIFVLPERPGNNSAGLYWVRLQLRKTARGVAVSRMRAPFVAGQSPGDAIAWGDEVILLEGPYAMTLSYRAPRAGLRDWAGTWLTGTLMPGEIRIDVADPSTGLPAVPVFVAALKVTAEASCGPAKAPGCTMASNGVITPEAVKR